MHVIGTVLGVAAFTLLAVLGRAVFVYARPERECRWCRPGGLIRGSLIGRLVEPDLPPRRKRRCWRCKTTRRYWRLGARQVHELKLSLQQAWAERGES
jgi:hypothetical protein